MSKLFHGECFEQSIIFSWRYWLEAEREGSRNKGIMVHLLDTQKAQKWAKARLCLGHHINGLPGTRLGEFVINCLSTFLGALAIILLKGIRHDHVVPGGLFWLYYSIRLLVFTFLAWMSLCHWFQVSVSGGVSPYLSPSSSFLKN